MSRIGFGAFLAPHHPIGENPTLQFRRDLDLAEQLDKLGFDEFWCGEHHSTGWEMIASPELFLAAAGERTHRIKLGTGVVSLPYHHPFNVAQRIVQLDHMTRGRVIFGSGPGALAFDNPDQAVEEMSGSEDAGAIIGTPDDLVNALRRMVELTGGFGTAIGFVHDWANRDATSRSWDMVARYVMPEVNGMT